MIPASLIPTQMIYLIVDCDPKDIKLVRTPGDHRWGLTKGPPVKGFSVALSWLPVGFIPKPMVHQIVFSKTEDIESTKTPRRHHERTTQDLAEPLPVSRRFPVSPILI